jgi:hypothetical protein
MQFAEVTSDTLAQAIVAELNRPIAYRPVSSTGASKAAMLIAEVLS